MGLIRKADGSRADRRSIPLAKLKAAKQPYDVVHCRGPGRPIRRRSARMGKQAGVSSPVEQERSVRGTVYHYPRKSRYMTAPVSADHRK